MFRRYISNTMTKSSSITYFAPNTWIETSSILVHYKVELDAVVESDIPLIFRVNKG